VRLARVLQRNGRDRCIWWSSI